MARENRVLLGIPGTGLVGLLAVAAWLQPNPSGFGTHQQLGLPPCTFATVVRRPCPSCGMTTSWAYLLDGRLLLALQANSGGTLLALLSLAAGPWMLATALYGRMIWGRPPEWLLVAVAIVIGIATLAQWGWRLAF